MKKIISVILCLCVVMSCMTAITSAAVQYPKENVILDTSTSGIAALSNEYGDFSIMGTNHTENQDGSLTLGSDEGVQFTPNEKFAQIFKNGALLEFDFSFALKNVEADKGNIILMRNSQGENLPLFEYYKAQPKVRAFSWNQKETKFDSTATVSDAEFDVNIKINTKSGFGDASFVCTKDSTVVKNVIYTTLNLNNATANGNIKYNTLWQESPKLLRFYLSAGDVIKKIKVTMTDLSTDNLYESINTAETVKDVENVFDYYSKNGTFSYGDSFLQFSDDVKTTIYNRFIGQNFKTDAEVQALFDKLVEKQFSIVKKIYTYDFEDGQNPFSNSELISVNDNKVLRLTGTSQMRISDLLNAEGPIVTQYDYHYNTDSGEGTYFGYLTQTSRMVMSKVNSSKNICLSADGTVSNVIHTSKGLTKGNVYGMQQCFDKSTLRAQTNIKEPSESTYVPVRTDASGKNYLTFESFSDGKIDGVDLRSNTSDYFDNITIKVYNPVYTALSYTETAEEVKNVFDTYKSIGALDVSDNLGDAVYEQFVGSSYKSTESLESAIKAVSEFAATGRDAYVYDTYVKSGDAAIDTNFNAGTITYGAKAYTDIENTGVILVIAQYKDKELINLTYAKKNLTKGFNDISDTLTIENSENTTLKIFAIDKNANPYVVHKTLSGM